MTPCMVTHKIDIYSLGHILFTLLTGEYPYARSKFKFVEELVQQGAKPRIPEKYLESSDSKIQVLIEAMRECWNKKPEQLPSAEELKDKLQPFVVYEDNQ